MRKRWFGFAGWMMVGGTSLVAAAACSNGLGPSDCEASRTCADADEPGGGAGGDAAEPATAGASGSLSLPDGGASAEPSAGGAAGASEGGAGHDAPVNASPFVIEITPKSDAGEIEPGAVIKISFSEPLAPASVSTASVQLFDGKVLVPGSVSYAGSQVTFKPDTPLGLLGDYKLVVSVAVTDEAGAHLAEPFESHFSVRDGKFSTQIAVDQPSFQLAESLPMTARGEALLAWSDRNNATLCPVLGAWFNPGVAGDAATLSAAGATECDSVAVGANAAGVAAVAWAQFYDAPGVYIKQFRNGAWSGGNGKVSPHTASSRFRVAVAPTGMVTLFDNGSPGSWAYRTDASGDWAPPDTLSSNTTAVAAPEVTFDAAGNGLAIWRAKTAADIEELLSSSYSVQSGKWAAAKLVPGTLASAARPSYERGAPALALDSDGNAVALWVKHDGDTRTLMASRFNWDQGWQAPTAVAPDAAAETAYEPPGLVFDGQTFVAAFTASDGNALGAYTTRFDAQQEQWSEPELRSGPDSVAARMPRLATDHRGNALLVWATGTNPSFKLVYQRYAQGAWSKTADIPDGSFNNKYFDLSNAPMPLTVNDGGYGALAWGNYDASNHLATIRLASFF